MIAPHFLCLLFQIISVTILLRLQLMRRRISLWCCAGRSAPKEGTNCGAIGEHYVLPSYHPRTFPGVCSSFAWLFTGLDEVLGRVERMEESSSRIVAHISETTDISGDETEGSEMRTYKMEKVCGGGWAKLLFCDWANGRIRETQSLFTAAFVGRIFLSWPTE